MEFEFDSVKSASNLEKHGIDFGAVQAIWQDVMRVEIRARTTDEPRWLVVGQIDGKHWSVVVTYREQRVIALSLFELGHVFRQAMADDPKGLVEGVVEWEQLGLVAVGHGAGAAYAVRAWQVLAEGTRVARPAVVPLPVGASGAGGAGALTVAGSLHPGRRAALLAGGRTIGVVGEVAPEVAERHDLKGGVALLLVDLAGLLGAVQEGRQVRPTSRYPASDLDMAFLVADEVTAGALEATLREAIAELAEALALFDVWRDRALGEGRRGLAFRARLRAPDHTLTDSEVAEVRERAALAALQRHGAVLRRA